jgi:hypothetical protein
MKRSLHLALIVSSAWLGVLSFTFDNGVQNKLILNALEWLGSGKKTAPSSDR